jgi:hypothetical protein
MAGSGKSPLVVVGDALLDRDLPWSGSVNGPISPSGGPLASAFMSSLYDAAGQGAIWIPAHVRAPLAWTMQDAIRPEALIVDDTNR